MFNNSLNRESVMDKMTQPISSTLYMSIYYYKCLSNLFLGQYRNYKNMKKK